MGLHQDICVKSEKVSDVEEFLEGFSGFFRVEYKGCLFVISSEAGAAIGLGACIEDFDCVRIVLESASNSWVYFGIYYWEDWCA